jgi:glyoxylase-like metal-dependent hydrolase (beta-lactamase superfamily II)
MEPAMLVVRHAVVGPFAENTYVAACDRTREAVLIDPGGELERVRALLEPGGFRVTRIVLTHAHIDHAAGAEEARRVLGVPLWAHPAEEAWLAMLPGQAEMFGFEDAIETPQVDHWMKDGERFPVGDLEARVLHTPGHTLGSCAVWFEAAGVVFTGDTLFAGSVGRTDLPGGDFASLERSIKEVLFPLGDGATFHPGHGPEGTLGEERRHNPFVGTAARRGRFL